MKIKVTMFLLLFCLNFQSKAQEIVNFNVSQLNIDGVNQIELTWQSIDEYLWCHFIVERDVNNQGNFIPYHTLSANGDAIGSTLNYLFTDFDVQNGNSYCYRLSLDTLNLMDSECYFNRITDTVCINFLLSVEESNALSSTILYSNPFSTQTTLQTNKPIQNAILTIYNYKGQIVKQISNLSGQTFTLLLNDLPSGFYFANLTTESGELFSNNKLIIVDN